MIVVLDTNVMFGDFWMAKNVFQVFFGGLPLLPARMCVPEVVVHETVNKFREELEKRTLALNNAKNALCDLLGPMEFPCESEGDIGARVKGYEKHLRATIEKNDGKILPYPKDSHLEVVQYSLSRRKPFNAKGQGYRDYLIWASIRTEMYYAAEESVIFITNNGKDFCNGTVLASDLQEQLDSYHRRGRTICISPSLRDFNDSHIFPLHNEMKRLGLKLAEKKVGSFDLRTWAISELPEALRWEEYLGEICFGYPSIGVGCRVGAIDTIENIDTVSIVSLPNGMLHIQVELDAQIVCHLDVTWEAYRSSEEVRETIEFGMEPGDSASWDLSTKIAVGMSVIVNEESGIPESSEVIRIKGELGVLEY